VDLTEDKEYTLSPTTKSLLSNLQEPLLIRGYFSEKTHPLLAPLVPSIRDMLREYQVASGGMLQLEIIDPAKEPEKEAEANQVYGIQPTPFQVAGRYEASVINSYFDLLLQYGDQSVTLGFNDIIEVDSQRMGSVDVRLRNLEYDLTANIKKVVYGFQNIDAVLASLPEPVEVTVYMTPNTLPDWLQEAPTTIDAVLKDFAGRSNGKFTYNFVDPDAPDSPIGREELYELYGLQPIADSLFSVDTYYLYMLLKSGEKGQLIYPSGEVSEADVRSAVESALKRSSSGFLQVVGLWTPPETPTQDMFGQTQPAISSWNQVRQVLEQEYEVRTVDLSSGSIEPDIDVMVIVGPQDLDEKSLYAIDQYLMRGGALVLATGHAGIMASPMGGLGAKPVTGELHTMLAHYGFTLPESLVLDPRNEPFPVPVVRQVGEFQVQEIQQVPYPFFVDIRPDSMTKGHPIVSNLQAVTLNWASPIEVDQDKNADRTVEVLLQSTGDAWTQQDFNIQPDYELYPEYGFANLGETRPYTLAVAVQGAFESYFVGKPSPLQSTEEETEGEGPQTQPQAVAGTIESSPETSRMVLIGSLEFVDDVILELSASMGTERYLNNLSLVQNAVAWSVEDLDLLNISARGTAARILIELTEQQQSFWEVANYVLALVALVVVSGVSGFNRRNEEPLQLIPQDELGSVPFAASEVGRKTESEVAG
jgi:ABC-2 type transport system permease protein